MIISKKYKVERSEGDIKPEETLVDSISSYASIESPIGRGVFNVFLAAVFLILSILILKSFQLQIIDGSYFAALAERSSYYKFPLSSLRGSIFDRNGTLLATSVPSFDLVVFSSHLLAGDELKKDQAFVADITGMSYEQIRSLFETNNANASFVIKRGLGKEQVLKLRSAGLSGFYIVANAERYYTYGSTMAHLIGYAAAVDSSDLGRDHYYLATDRIGRLGLEANYENLLRGEHRFFDFNDPEADSGENGQGKGLILNIDAEMQQKLFEILSDVFRSSGLRRGAALIQDPNTGSVFAMVSMPTFDPNIFGETYDENNKAKISKILSDSSNPLLNRTTSGKYSPGSTIKPLLALAGLKEGVITSSTTIMAEGSISIKSEVDPDVFYTFRDWRVHGLTDLKKAIADSVDVFFYALGGGYGDIKGLGADKMAKYFKIFGADQITGVDLPGEIAGFVPTREWKKDVKGESWYIGDSYNLSIGQGDLLVTPLWLNTYISSIANGGQLMVPKIVKKVVNSEGGIIEKMEPEILSDIPFTAQAIETIREAMRETVLSGTAVSLKDLPVTFAAKTGTAQATGGKANSFFSVFGPYEKPKIAMTILVEDIKESQGLAIRVAKDFLLWYLSQGLSTTNL